MADWMSKLQGFLGLGDEEPEPQAPEPKVPLAYRQSFIGAPYPEDEPPMSPRRQKWERGWAEHEYEEEHPTKLHKAMEVLGTLVDVADPGALASQAITAPFQAFRKPLSEGAIKRFKEVAGRLGESKKVSKTLKGWGDELTGAVTQSRRGELADSIPRFKQWKTNLYNDVDKIIDRVPKTQQKWMREAHEGFAERMAQGGVFDSANPNARTFRRTMEGAEIGFDPSTKKVGLETAKEAPIGAARYHPMGQSVEMKPSGNLEVDIGVIAHEYGHHYQKAARDKLQKHVDFKSRADKFEKTANRFKPGSRNHTTWLRKSAEYRAKAMRLGPEVNLYSRLSRIAKTQEAQGGYRRAGTQTEISTDIIAGKQVPEASEAVRAGWGRTQPAPHGDEESLSDILHMMTSRRGWTEMTPDVRRELTEMFPGAAFKHGDVDFAIPPMGRDIDLVPGGAELSIGPGRGMPLRTQPDIDLTLGEYFPQSAGQVADPDIGSMLPRRSKLAPGYQ